MSPWVPDSLKKISRESGTQRKGILDVGENNYWM